MRDNHLFRAWSKDTKEMLPPSEFMYPEWFDDKNVDVMQCTGLKDKKGTLIYEGDILKESTKGKGNKSIVSYVIWLPTCAAFCTDDGEHLCDVVNPMGEDKESRVRIIGNIWQNPKLVGLA